MEKSPSYNDIDILISVDLSSNSSTIHNIKTAVLDALISFACSEDDKVDDDHKSAGITPEEDRPCLFAHDFSQRVPIYHLTLRDKTDDGGWAVTSKSVCSRELEEWNSIKAQDRTSLTLPTGNQSDQYLAQKCLYVVTQHSPSSVTSNCTPSPPSYASMRESYVFKQFRKYGKLGEDCWSLISLGAPSSESKVVEFKFVDRMRRQFEFTVDSFQIHLSSMFSFLRKHPGVEVSQNFHPTVVVESVAGPFSEAHHHLKNKVIITKEPEMIRGGGLLKYCRLLVNGYQAANGIDILSLERYMSSRFFIDFQDLASQKAKIEAFLTNHFTEDELDSQIQFLKTVHRVVSGASVCLMSYERYQILHMIRVMLQNFMYESCMRKSTISLDWFAEQQNLVPDHIYMGNNLFPSQASLETQKTDLCDCEKNCEAHQRRTNLYTRYCSSSDGCSMKIMPTTITE